MTNQSAADRISLPRGGAALAGIGETFQPNLHTGTGNFQVPLPLPPGSNGFQSPLTLAFRIANPPGPFGLGCALPRWTYHAEWGRPDPGSHSRQRREHR